MNDGQLLLGVVAGEASGDRLGASLITSLKKSVSVSVEGIGGPEMEQAGCRSIYPMNVLSVMGLIEVLGNLGRILKIRNHLATHFINSKPDIFIGIDAPDFNLELERRLRNHGIKTVHYVSPQVWAWREYRLKKIKRSVDLMLTLFPFETTYYKNKGIPAVYVGHPLAEEIPVVPDPGAARSRLGLPQDSEIIAILPGSRKMEIQNLLGPFLMAAEKCYRTRQDIHIVCSLLTDSDVHLMKSKIRDMSLEQLPVTIFKGESHAVLESADAVLLASGTVTLEAMLYKKPMVVAYKVRWLTYRILKLMLKTRFVSLPNILAGEEIVSECLQHACTPERLYREIVRCLNDGDFQLKIRQKFTELHRSLKIKDKDILSRELLRLTVKNETTGPV